MYMPERDERDVELLGMIRAEYSRAKTFVYWGYGFELVAAVAGVLVIRFVPDQYGALAALLVAAVATVGYFFKRRYDAIRSYAEEARRVVVLMKGLDYRISEKKRAELEKPFSASARQVAKQKLEENRSYFSTTATYGPLKIFDMLQESAFWTHSLMEKAAKYAGGLSLGFVALVGLALYFMAFVTTGLKQNWASDLFVATVLIFLTSGILLLRNAYVQIGAKITRIDDELEAIREAKHAPTVNEVLARLNEYDCRLMEAPVLPDFIYEWNKSELNAAWDKRQQEYKKQIWS
jgi:hypothetical protein